MKAIKKAVAAAMLTVIVSFVAGCYAYVEHDRHYRRGYYDRDYPYRHRDYSYRYSHRFESRW